MDSKNIIERTKTISFGVGGGMLGGMSWPMIVEYFRSMLCDFICK